MRTIEKYEGKADWYLLKEGETVKAAGSLEHCKLYARAGHNQGTTAKVATLPLLSALESRRWLLANGAQEVDLFDKSDTGWETFCAWLVKGSVLPQIGGAK